ncbi:DUF6268 family outer membrane beta-barrel protein [uncultured Thiocystis sp.]|jgi:hypothetical protein|uniref:DUF6268 family outer membrane beta-barrel protein n=1 Tax=uncultured Thiocystis sp. TaxID=1202134 RepID=UPI0025EF5B69|nr:DUF6268 family outer membrane beta-barrel protein [uncultured Thiocystis sp.]
MSNRVSIHSAFALTTVILTGSAAAQAPADFSYSISPLLHTESDLDGGGEAGFAGVLTTFGRSWTLDRQSSLGLRLQADYEDWRFDRVGGFGGVEPWGQLYRVGLSASYGFMTDDGWRLSVTPTVEYSGESGANFSDALEYGATVSAARRIRPDLTLGLGVGAFARIEENSLFPFLIVDWRITDRLRLSNPFLAGPAGPAGLEMSYALNAGWEAGIGASYRSYRHRLDEDGPFAGGVGENRYIPVYLRIGRDLSKTLKLSLYAGAATSATLRVEDANGNRLYEEDQDPAAMLGLSLIGRF